jgi:UDP-N-acetylglucosamine 2-epimerase (non-hydrolysing)
MKKIHLIVGARPNIIKASPVYHALHSLNKFDITIINTGQHYDKLMMDIFIKELEFKTPDINLKIGSGSHGSQTAKIIHQYEEVLLKSKPDAIIVFGDVNSTLACTIAAKKMMIDVIHIESGLRSYDKDMPEEINRIMVDSVADYCFTTCEDASLNLIKEGKSEESIFMMGNTMIDSLVKFEPRFNQSTVLDQYNLNAQDYILFTMHRPSNVDNQEKLSKIINQIKTISKDYKCFFPIHPRTLHQMKDLNLLEQIEQLPNIILSGPLGYFDFMSVQKNAKLIVTDSGGIQEESTYFGIQCLTVRENTERPVTITEGTNTLIGNSINNISKEIKNVLQNPKQSSTIKYWDGHSGERIAKIIQDII